MKNIRMALIGIVALAAPFIATSAFAGQATFNTYSPNTGYIAAYGTGSNHAYAYWTASQQSGYAYTNNYVYSAVGSYSGSAQVRCNGNNKIWAQSFYSPTNQATATCGTTGNAWAGTLWSN